VICVYSDNTHLISKCCLVFSSCCDTCDAINSKISFFKATGVLRRVPELLQALTFDLRSFGVAVFPYSLMALLCPAIMANSNLALIFQLCRIIYCSTIFNLSLLLRSLPPLASFSCHSMLPLTLHSFHHFWFLLKTMIVIQPEKGNRAKFGIEKVCLWQIWRESNDLQYFVRRNDVYESVHKI